MKKVIFLFLFVFFCGCIEEPLIEVFSIEAVCDSNGYVTPNRVKATDRDTVKFVVNLDDNCVIASVTVNGKNITSSLRDNTLSLSNIKSDLKISFIVVKKEIPLKDFVITANSGPNGSISPSGEITVKENTSKVFKMIPINIGYEMDILKVNNIVVDTTSKYTFENISSENKIEVTWKKDPIMWPFVNILWRLDSVGINDTNYTCFYNSFVETIDISLDGEITFLLHGKNTYKEKLNFNKKEMTIIFFGSLYDVKINEHKLILTYINGYNQKVSMIYKNEKYKNSP